MTSAKTKSRGEGALALSVAILATGIVFSPVQGQTVPAWQYSSPAAIQEFKVTETGAVAVLSDSGLVLLDPTDGHALWSRPAAFAYRALGASNLVLVASPRTAEVIELESGNSRWHMDGPQSPLQAFSGIALPLRNLLLIYGGTRDSGFTVLAVSLDSGVVRWRQDTLFSRPPKLARQAMDIRLGGAQPILFDSDTTIVIFASHGGVVRINTGTGDLLWWSDTLARAKPLRVSEGFAAMVLDSGALLVPYDKKLMALNSGNGAVIWDHRENFPGALAEIVPTPRGLLVRGYHRHTRPSESIRAFVDLLDPATGRSRWSRPVRDLDDASAMLVRGDTAYLASRGKLFAVGLESGQLSQSARFPFRGGETPWRVEAMGEEILILSSQNMVCLKPGGEPRYARYYGAPGASLFAKVLSTVLIVGLNVASSQLAYPGSLHPVIANNPVLDARYKATVAANRQVHMLTGAADTTGHKGFSVVRLDKETGNETGRVWVNDRSPDYILDPASATVYLLRDKRRLEALRF